MTLIRTISFLILYFLTFSIDSNFATVKDTNQIYSIANDINLKRILETLTRKDDILLFIYNDKFKYFLPKYLRNVMCLWNVEDENIVTFENEANYCINYVIFATNEDIYDLISSLRNSTFWTSGPKTRDDKYFIFFFFDSPNKLQIFTHLWKMEMINVLLFEMDNDLDWNVYTYRPFLKESKCGNVIQSLSVPNLTTFKFREEHPNMKYCKLNISYTDIALLKQYFYDPPYALLIPFLILEELYELNYTYFSMPLEYQMNPLIAAIYVKEEVSNNEYDGVIGIPIRQFEYPVVFDNVLELSRTLGFDEFMWILPKPQRIPNVRILLTIFPISIYLMCLFTTLFMIIVWISISKMTNLNEYDIMGILSVTLGFGMRTPKLIILKIIFVSYLFYASHIIYFFQGNFSSKLLIPQYEKRIRTMIELIDSNIEMQLHETQREMLFATSDMPSLKRLYDKIYNSEPLGFNETIECSELLNKSKTRYAVRNSRTSSTYDQRCAEYMDTLLDDISPNLAFSYVFRSGHPILTYLNAAIKIYQECGFINKAYYSLALPANYNPIEAIVSLTFEHFQASFLILAVGIFNGLIIFVVEIFYHRRYNDILYDLNTSC